MASKFSSSSTNASQIQKNWSTYKANKKYQSQLKGAERKQPTYKDAYKGYKDAVVNQLENSNFEFDTNNPVYQAYANDYRLLGNIAADASQANIEGLSGGYGTTYSGTVAQQGLESHLANEKNIIPALYQQERANYQAEQGNLANRANLYNQLESQDFAQFQDKLARWNANRDYYYNKFINDYQQSARQHSTSRATENSAETTTSITAGRGGSGRSNKYSRMNANSLKSREGAMAYLSDNGLDASNVISKEQFAAENASRGWNAYNGALYEEGEDGYSAKAKKQLDSDYQDYLLNYIRQAQGYEDKDWFSKKQKKLGYSNRKH